MKLGGIALLTSHKQTGKYLQINQMQIYTRACVPGWIHIHKNLSIAGAIAEN